MPLCDSSETSTRAVRPKPSPAVLRLTFVAGIPEVSRFSCMKFLGVSGVFDYAGLNRNSRYRSGSCCLPRITKDVGVRVASFRSSIAHPAYSPVYASSVNKWHTGRQKSRYIRRQCSNVAKEPTAHRAAFRLKSLRRLSGRLEIGRAH